MFEWDADKATANVRKHRVAFGEATAVFADPNALDGPDMAHSAGEPRFLRLGRVSSGQVIMVAYTVRGGQSNGETIRIISARRASRKERAAYASGSAD